MDFTIRFLPKLGAAEEGNMGLISNAVMVVIIFYRFGEVQSRSKLWMIICDFEFGERARILSGDHRARWVPGMDSSLEL